MKTGTQYTQKRMINIPKMGKLKYPKKERINTYINNNKQNNTESSIFNEKLPIISNGLPAVDFLNEEWRLRKENLINSICSLQ